MMNKLRIWAKTSWALLKRHKFKFSLLFVGFLIVGRAAANMKPAQEAVSQKPKAVNVLMVSDLVSDGATVPVVGALQASQHVDIRPQMPGQVSAIWTKVGAYVRAGQVLAELSHSDLDAAVGQASANLQSALAQLAKAKNGSRPEDIMAAEQNLIAAQQQLADMRRGGRPEEVAQAQNNVAAAETALNDANTNYVRTEEQNALSLSQSKENAVLAIAGARLSADDVLLEELDDVYNENDGDNLFPVLEDGALKAQAENARDDAGMRLRAWNSRTSALTASDTAAVTAALTDAESELRSFLSFLDLTNAAVQDAVAVPVYDEADITAAKASVNAARATIKAQINAMVAARQTIESVLVSNQKNLEAARSRIDSAATQLKNLQEALQIVMKGPSAEQIAAQEARVKQAEQQLNIAKNGARPEDLRIQEAMVAQARASVALAAAQREKAIIRAPIAGTVTYIPIKLGDVVSSSNIAVSLSNPSVLEVEVYVSEAERRFLAVGNEAAVNDSIKAEIREIAPALDPINSKVKVLVTLLEPAPTLTLGETVRVSLTKIAPEETVLRVPLSSVKFTSAGTEMYRVNDDNTLEVVAVETGSVSANTVEITTALEHGWRFAKDVRGLKDGQPVTVK